MSLLMENSVAKIGCGDPGELIEFAALLNGSSSNPGYLRCAPGAADPSYKVAFSGWVKAVTVGGAIGPLISAGISAPASQWITSTAIGRGDGSTVNTASIAAEHKDAAAWGHILIKADTTGGTLAANRAEFTIGGYTYALDVNLMGDAISLFLMDPQYWQAIGANINSAGGLISSNSSFKIASVDIITGDDVDSVEKEYFGYFNTDGVFVPKRYRGAYGRHGRRFDFAKAADMGRDVSPRNACLHSEDVSHPVWIAQRVSKIDAETFEAADAFNPYIHQTLAVELDDSYLIDVEIDPASNPFCSVFVNDGVGEIRQWFNLAGLAVGSAQGTLTVVSADIAALSDGFVRCSLEVVANAGQTLQEMRLEICDADLSVNAQAIGNILRVRKMHVREASRNYGYAKTDGFARGGQDFETVGTVGRITDTPTSNTVNFDPNIAGDAGNFLNGNATVIGNNSVHSSLSHPIKTGVVQVELEIGYGNTNSGSLRVSNDPNFNSTAQTVHYRTDGQKYVSGAWSAYGVAWGSPTFPSDRMGVLIDADNQTVEFFKGGASQGVISMPFAGPYFVGGTKAGLNEGAVTVYTNLADMLHPIAGAKTLEWDSADCPVITDPSRYVQAPITIGGGAVTSLWNCVTNKTLAISKRLDIANSGWRLNVLIDGEQYTVEIDEGGAQVFDVDGLTFTTNGFTLGSDTEYQGTCEHSVRRASALAGMDFVIIDNHVVGQVSTIAHNCGGPIHRAWDIPLDGGDIRQFHHKMPAGDYTLVNTAGRGNDPDWFSSTVNTVSLAGASVVGRHLLLLDHGVSGFSSFDVCTGNGVVDGPMIPADFAPLHLDVVRGDTAGAHTVRTLRAGDVNPVINELRYDWNTGPNTLSDKFYLLSNGAKCATNASDTGGEHTNANGGKYYTGMYALTPGKFAKAR
ncbi:hypothetical protein ACTU44_08835 [Thalassospira sp. SM2505]